MLTWICRGTLGNVRAVLMPEKKIDAVLHSIVKSLDPFKKNPCFGSHLRPSFGFKPERS